MKKLTYKDLKALFSVNTYFDKKAITHFFYLTLSEVLPIISDDIDWFLDFLETQSKHSLDKNDEKGLLQGDLFTWNNKYLYLSEHYLTLNRKLRFVLRRWVMENNDDKPLEISTMKEWLDFVKETAETFQQLMDTTNYDDYLELTDWLSKSSEKNAVRLKHFIELSFASTFNHISLVENKATITSLLKAALYDNKIENFKKIFSVDPSVFDLKDVQTFINSQDRKTKAKINRYYSDSIDIPIISNNKNKISQKPMFIIGMFDSMNIINGQISFSKTRLLHLGTLTGICHNSIDQSYFNKLLNHIKK